MVIKIIILGSLSSAIWYWVMILLEINILQKKHQKFIDHQ